MKAGVIQVWEECEEVAKETVQSVAKQVAAGSMTPAEAGLKIRGLITRVAPPRDEAERMKRYEESYNEAAIETDPNSFLHISVLFHEHKITMDQLKDIMEAMDSKTSLTEGTQ